jgi:hypothetical protein
VVNEADRGCGALDIEQKCTRGGGFEVRRQTQPKAGSGGR